jgi:hypothetical protein
VTPPSTDAATTTVTVSAWIGWINAPRARLRVSPDQLELSAPILGQFRFAPHEVIALEQGFGWAVRVEHIRPDVPQHLSIRTLPWGQSLVDQVAAAGFLPTAKRSDAPAIEPVLHARFVAALVFAQLAFMAAVAWRSRVSTQGPDILMIVWISTVLALSVLIRVEGPVRRFAVASPRGFGRLVPFLNLTTVLTIVLAIAVVATAF